MTDLLVEAIRSAVRAELAAQLAPLVDALRAAVPPRLLSIAEAAIEARVSACTMRRWEASGEVRGVRRGGRVLIDASSLAPAGAQMQSGAPAVAAPSEAGQPNTPRCRHSRPPETDS